MSVAQGAAPQFCQALRSSVPQRERAFGCGLVGLQKLAPGQLALLGLPGAPQGCGGSPIVVSPASMCNTNMAVLTENKARSARGESRSRGGEERGEADATVCNLRTST